MSNKSHCRFQVGSFSSTHSFSVLSEIAED